MHRSEKTFKHGRWSNDSRLLTIARERWQLSKTPGRIRRYLRPSSRKLPDAVIEAPQMQCGRVRSCSLKSPCALFQLLKHQHDLVCG